MSIEPACIYDPEEAVQLVEWMANFNYPNWRSRQEIIESDKRVLRNWFSDALTNDHFLCCQRKQSNPGLMLLERRKGYFSWNEVLQVAILAVSRAFEGKRVGSALMGFAESRHFVLTYLKEIKVLFSSIKSWAFARRP